MTTEDLTVATWNIERFGYDEGRGHARLAAAIKWLLQQAPVPDVLALPEARGALQDGQSVIRSMADELSRHLPGGGRCGRYEVLLSSGLLEGRRNHLHAILVNNRLVHPLAWWDPHAPDAAARTDGFTWCRIYGHRVGLCCEHWDGGKGRTGFDAAVSRLHGHGGRRNKTILLGDFNADSGWEKELHQGIDWYAVLESKDMLHKLEEKWWQPEPGRWIVDTRPLDKLRTFMGYRDMGEEWGDPTPTSHPDTGSGLRIDRIFRSTGLPAEVIDYQVRQPPRELSDHAYVFGTLRIKSAH